MTGSANPLISIIIPTYNHSSYLGRAIKSVFEQTYGNWEVIIIDNHSTDDTNDVVEKFNDKRIKYLKIRNNGIIAASRNRGINVARGNWIAFLDSDDFWSSDKLEECSKYFNSKVDLIYHDLKLLYDKCKPFWRRNTTSRQLKSPVLYDLLINGNVIVNSTVIVRKKFLTEIGGICEDKNMVASEDYNAWLKIAALTERFVYLPKSLGSYRVHSGGISQKDMSKPDYAAVAEFKSRLTTSQIIQIEKMHNYVRGRFHYVNKEYDVAESALKQALSSRNIAMNAKVILMLILILVLKRL